MLYSLIINPLYCSLTTLVDTLNSVRRPIQQCRQTRRACPVRAGPDNEHTKFCVPAQRRSVAGLGPACSQTCQTACSTVSTNTPSMSSASWARCYRAALRPALTSSPLELQSVVVLLSHHVSVLHEARAVLSDAGRRNHFGVSKSHATRIITEVEIVHTYLFRLSQEYQFNAC